MILSHNIFNQISFLEMKTNRIRRITMPCVYVCPFYFPNHMTDFHKTVYEHYYLGATLSSHFWLSYSQLQQCDISTNVRGKTNITAIYFMVITWRTLGRVLSFCRMWSNNMVIIWIFYLAFSLMVMNHWTTETRHVTSSLETSHT